MGSGIFFPICAIPFSILIIILFFEKGFIKNNETKIYKYLMVINFFGLLIEILCTFASLIYSEFPLISDFIYKLYLLYIITWTGLFMIYMYSISPKRKDLSFNSKQMNIIILVFGIIACILYLLPIDLVIQKDFEIRYTTGLSVYFTYGVCSIMIMVMLYLLLENIKNFRSKKYIPLYMFFIVGVSAVIIQTIFPQFLLLTYVHTFCTVIMYFTIENPDIKMIEQLDLAKKRAEQANQAKTDFLSSMSHEIRTPLNAIVGFSQALQTEDIPDSAKEEVDDIIMASNGLLEIVNGILDISKIEANKLEIINTDYSFKKVYEELILLAKARMGETNLDFRHSMDPTIPATLYGDHARIKQIVLNILTNAIKYTKEGYVDFRVNSVISGDICRLIISVEDSGIGIKPENVNKLFTNFERLGVEKEITIEGTGLGLAITKKLVELMNGTIVVQTIYGKGSKFTISIDQKITKTVLVEEQVKETEELNIIDCSNKKILIVDDNKINLKVASRLLQDYHIMIETCLSGQECIDKILNNQTYDLIFMDDMMPKMSGVETLNKLKSIETFNIPTVALTANAITGMKEEYLGHGFSDYLAKPIEKRELNRIIIKFLGKK